MYEVIFYRDKYEKTQKTPYREIERAEKYCKNFLQGVD